MENTQSAAKSPKSVRSPRGAGSDSPTKSRSKAGFSICFLSFGEAQHSHHAVVRLQRRLRPAVSLRAALDLDPKPKLTQEV